MALEVLEAHKPAHQVIQTFVKVQITSWWLWNVKREQNRKGL
jgi:hypothetical protein